MIVFGVLRQSTILLRRTSIPIKNNHYVPLCGLSDKANQGGRRYSSTHASTQSSQTGNEPSQYYDIVIAGGGMVGTSLASAIGQDNLFADKKLLVLEAMPDTSSLEISEQYSNRVCALSPATVDFLEGIGAWPEIEVMRAQSVRRMQVWDACSDAMITFDRDEGPLAHIVENNVILEALKRSLAECSENVEVRYSTKVKNYDLPHKRLSNADCKGPVVMELTDGQKIRTKLLVGADGANSFLRKCAGIHHVGWEYGKAGVVATLHLSEHTENHCAWQRFLPTGPIALLPLSATRSSLVWSTTTEEAKHLINLPPDSFVDAVNKAYLDESNKDRISSSAQEVMNDLISRLIPASKDFNRQLPPGIVDVDQGSRAMFPLGLGHASRYVESRLALIGDSAHRVHPLAGQGVNLGFADAECLAEVISDALLQGGDVGSIHRLLEYETRRQRHVLTVMATIDGLSRLYDSTFTPVVLARTLGLQATNALKPVKDWLMQFAISHR